MPTNYDRLTRVTVSNASNKDAEDIDVRPRGTGIVLETRLGSGEVEEWDVSGENAKPTQIYLRYRLADIDVGDLPGNNWIVETAQEGEYIKVLELTFSRDEESPVYQVTVRACYGNDASTWVATDSRPYPDVDLQEYTTSLA